MSQENTTQNEVTVSVPTAQSENLKRQFLIEISKPFPFKINKFDWVSPKFPIVPICLRLEHYPNQYNAFRMKCLYNLSKNARVKIPVSIDAFDGIHIPCVDPQIDIKSVTLYMCLTLPKKDCSHIEDAIFHEHMTQKVYVPVKTVTNFTSNRITFADRPIITDQYFPYSVSIEYADHILDQHLVEFLHTDFYVEIEHYFFLNTNKVKLLNPIVKALNSI